MKLLIVNSHLETGGIRQSLLNLIDNIDFLDIDIDLQLLKYDESLMQKYDQIKKINVLPPIRLINVYLTPFSEQKKVSDKCIKFFFWLLSKIIGKKSTMNFILLLVPNAKNYDVTISFSNDIWTDNVGGFHGGCNDYVLKKVKANKKIGWIHNEPYRLGFNHKICFETYKNFDTIVNVSHTCKNMFDEIIPEYKYKSKVVYNMFDLERICRLSKEASPYEEEEFHIVTVARLDNQQKRIDRIINCCEKLKNEGAKNFKWHIIGDGPDKDLLEALSKEKETDDVLFFEGRKDNPYPYMKYADIFMQSSDYEAYSMVLTESLSIGTPIICTNYPSAKEIILDGKNGMLTDLSEESICSTILKVMSEENILKDMRKYISQNKVSNERCLEQFNNVIRGI